MADSDTAGVVAPPPLLFGVGFVVALALHALQPILLVPPRYTMLGMIPVAAAGLLIGWAIRTMRDAGTRIEPWQPTAAICADGPYAYSRNPMYVGMALLWVGLTILVNSLWPLGVLPFVMAALTWGVIEREEHYLERKFGAEYSSYKASVRRWF